MKSWIKKTFKAILLSFLISTIFLLQGSQVLTNAKVDTNNMLVKVLYHSLTTSHISNTAVNDEFSEVAFKKFIERLDPNKQFFLQEDINYLQRYKTQVDDELQAGTLYFLDEAVRLLRQRIRQVKQIVDHYVDYSFDLYQEETFQADPEYLDFCASEEALKERWRKMIKYQIILGYLRQFEEENEDKKDIDFIVDEKLIKEARKTAKASLLRSFRRRMKKPRQDYLNLYLDVIAKSYDPHTSYFPPEDKEDFDIGMSGKLEGIGAVLREEDGYIKVVRVVPGSAAWKQGGLKAEDIILEVAQGNSRPVDIVDVPVREAVKLIRGKKKTVVKLTVKKPNGKIQLIPITRDVVVIEETYAKSVLVKDKQYNRKYGYIYLPSFYRDFSDKNARNAATDIRRILTQLSDEKVDGVVFDLRNNGGGALSDAVEISGLFIEKGPIVQIKNKRNSRGVHRDENPSVTYNGPLVILVNAFSASASEILAAALQDYRRTIVVGPPHTFGKGTVQSIYDFDRRYGISENLGSVKVTVQKYYRINGGSTQYKGVEPDIVIPTRLDYLEVGERTYERSMKWSQTVPLTYREWGIDIPIMKLKEQSQARVKQSGYFSQVKTYTEQMKKVRDMPRPLNIIQAWEQQASIKKMSDHLESLLPNKSDYELKVVEAGSPDEAKEWLEELKKDPGLEEAIAILNDWVK